MMMKFLFNTFHQSYYQWSHCQWSVTDLSVVKPTIFYSLTETSLNLSCAIFLPFDINLIVPYSCFILLHLFRSSKNPTNVVMQYVFILWTCPESYIAILHNTSIWLCKYYPEHTNRRTDEVNNIHRHNLF